MIFHPGKRALRAVHDLAVGLHSGDRDTLTVLLLLLPYYGIHVSASTTEVTSGTFCIRQSRTEVASNDNIHY